jgi:hypothetical protein
LKNATAKKLKLLFQLDDKTKLANQNGFAFALWLCLPTACVTCVWAGVDSAWEQEKLEARKMLENAAESHTSGARFVGQFIIYKLLSHKKIIVLEFLLILYTF